MPQLFYSAGSPYARIYRMALCEGGLTERVDEVETTLRDPAAVVLSMAGTNWPPGTHSGT
jgi:glutathione S-transferase